jgi:hypothetical protein
MTWPEVGKPLPRVRDAYTRPEKWNWILDEEGHGPHWRRVFRTLDTEQIWAAITGQLLPAPISLIRDLGALGRTCCVELDFTLEDRSATVVTIWHYDDENAAPRLVTAYPTT